MQRAVAIVLAGIAAALLAFTAAVIHGLASEYGADVFPDGSWAVFSLVPAGLALLCLVGARDPVGSPRPRTSVLAVGVLGVFMATGAVCSDCSDLSSASAWRTRCPDDRSR